MTETYQHRFASGRVCTVRVRYRQGQIPVLRCTNPRGDFTPEEFPEYLEWRKLVAAQTLRNLDPIAIAKLALSPDDDPDEAVLS
jgi:hypothetical protein